MYLGKPIEVSILRLVNVCVNGNTEVTFPALAWVKYRDDVPISVRFAREEERKGSVYDAGIEEYSALEPLTVNVEGYLKSFAPVDMQEGAVPESTITFVTSKGEAIEEISESV